MDLWECLISAIEALKLNRLRSLLTVSGVVIGVGMVIILVSLGEAAEQFVGDKMSGMGFGANAFVIHPGKIDPAIEPSKLSYPDCREMVKRIPEILDVVPVLVGSGYVRYGKQDYKTSIWGLTDNYSSRVSYRVEHGTFLSPIDVEQHRKVCVVGRKVAQTLFAGISPMGETVRVSGRRFTVIGVMEHKGEMLGIDLDDMVILPITSAIDLLDSERLTEIIVWCHDVPSIPGIEDKVSHFLSSRHMVKDDFHFHTQEEMLSVLGSISKTLTLFVSGLAGVSLLVGCIGITNIMLVSVVERTFEIGLRKALGARNRDIFRQFFAEAVLVSILGGLGGIVVGTLVGSLIMVPAGLPLHLSSWAIATALICSSLVGLISGVFPAMRAAKADPIQALRAD